MHDAIVTVVDETGARIDELAAAAQPDTVIVVVLTDGKENASETSQETVRQRVKKRREEDDWEFLFIGANQDAALTASEMGMDPDHSLNRSDSGEGTRAAYESTSERISTARQEGQTGGFQADNQRRQDDADGS